MLARLFTRHSSVIKASFQMVALISGQRERHTIHFYITEADAKHY